MEVGPDTTDMMVREVHRRKHREIAGFRFKWQTVCVFKRGGTERVAESAKYPSVVRRALCRKLLAGSLVAGISADVPFTSDVAMELQAGNGVVRGTPFCNHTE